MDKLIQNPPETYNTTKKNKINFFPNPQEDLPKFQNNKRKFVQETGTKLSPSNMAQNQVQNEIMGSLPENFHSEFDRKNFIPIIKRLEKFEGKLTLCKIHHKKHLKYYDIGNTEELMCSKCVIEMVVDKNFNNEMTKEEFQKKKQSEEFLDSLAQLTFQLRKLKVKINNDLSGVEEGKSSQQRFLSSTLNQLRQVIDEIEKKYTSRILKTHDSIKGIFEEKMIKLQKFEKEMNELERDVRLNYYNIIKLMDIEPFYDIICRYNFKLNKIKHIFNEFKNQPDEIPEEALRIKDLQKRMSFVNSFGNKLEGFIFDDEGVTSRSVSESENDCFKGWFGDVIKTTYNTNTREGDTHRRSLEVELLKGLLTYEGSTKDEAMRDIEKKDFLQQTEGMEMLTSTYKIKSIPENDDLKIQAEKLIRSVDSLISPNTGKEKINLNNANSKKAHRQLDYLKTLKLKQRYGKRYKNSAPNIAVLGQGSVGRTSSPQIKRKRRQYSTSIGNKANQSHSLTIDKKKRNRNSRSKTKKGLMKHRMNYSQVNSFKYLMGNRTNMSSSSPLKKRKGSKGSKGSKNGTPKSTANKNTSSAKLARFRGHVSKKVDKPLSKTERLLQLYRKNKISGGSQKHATLGNSKAK